jgi:hypothetical protein
MHEKKPAATYDSFKSVGASSLGAGTNPQLERVPALPAEAARDEGQMSRWVVLALAASSSFITTLDGSIVNIGLPAIAQTFHVGVSGAIEWVIIGYLVIIAAVLLTFGRLADMAGRRPIFFERSGHFCSGVRALRHGSVSLVAHPGASLPGPGRCADLLRECCDDYQCILQS